VKDFVSVRYGQPGLVVELAGGGFARLVLSLRGPQSSLAALGDGRS
jgi:hypothetical protein